MPVKKAKKPEKEKISKETTLGEIVQKFPKAVPFLAEAGLHCIGCHVSAFETLEQGCKAHGLSDKGIESLLKKMNKAL
jgi:hybrid cluster-associated redox disulfide protein